jgi:hypothetical protein
MLNPKDFPRGTQEIQSSILLGGSGKYKAKKKVIIRKLNEVVAQVSIILKKNFEY